MKKRMNFVGLFVLLLYVLMFMSCKDPGKNPEDGPSYEISGVLYMDCSMQPMANKYIELFQKLTHGFDNTTYGGVLSTTTTDANGNFKFVFKDLGGAEESIQYPAGAGSNTIFEKLPKNKSIDNLIVFDNPSTNIQVSLNVLNPHSSSDTLAISDYRNLQQLLLIPGPLVSGVLYTATNYNLLGMFYEGENKSVLWYFTPFNGGYTNKNFIIDKYCNDTIFITVDIN